MWCAHFFESSDLVEMCKDSCASFPYFSLQSRYKHSEPHPPEFTNFSECESYQVRLRREFNYHYLVCGLSCH